LDKISQSRHIRGVTLPRVQSIIPTWRKEPFDDPDWLFEFKYDGFRGLCYLEQGRCRFMSRNGNDPSARRRKVNEVRTEKTRRAVESAQPQIEDGIKRTHEKGLSA
jgi:bifunctional non-homologous end joining protein LigD